MVIYSTCLNQAVDAVKENEFIPFMLVTIAMVRPVLELGSCQGTRYRVTC